MNTGWSVGFRADASHRIGTGHIMRCLTLAREIQQQGGRCYFISRHIPETVARMIRLAGHQLIHLTAQDTAFNSSREQLAHADWLGTSQAFDADECNRVMTTLDLDWIVVDHYALDHHWETAVATSGVRIAVIDDLADRTHDCHLFINQNLVTDPETVYAGILPHHCSKLIGPEYALIRDEFLQQRALDPVRTTLNSVLVFFGGIDADDLTTQAIEALQGLNDLNLSVDIVIGSLHPQKAAVQQHCIKRGFNCFVQTNRMAELMARADLAIGAGGSASWERAYMGLPAILVSVAQNQTAIAREVGLRGAAEYLGTVQDFDQPKLQQALNRLHQQPAALETMSQQCLSLCDGLGKQRIIECMRTSQ